MWGGAGEGRGRVRFRPRVWFSEDREGWGSPGLYLLALSRVRLTLIYNKVTLLLWMETAPSSESKGG